MNREALVRLTEIGVLPSDIDEYGEIRVIHGLAETEGNPLFHWTLIDERDVNEFMKRNSGKWKRVIVIFSDYSTYSFDHF